MLSVTRTIAFLNMLVLAASYPIRIGCDFKVISSEITAGLNVMTTTENIMGAPPIDSNRLVSISTNEFTAGSSVMISFPNTFGMGLVHATAGTLIAPQFSAVPADGAAPCLGSETIKYENVGDDTGENTNSITWNAPSDVSALSTIAISFASASGFGPISRQTITLTKSGASNVQGVSQYKRIAAGTCASNDMDMIRDTTTGGAAAEVLGLSVASPGALARTDTPLPLGCFYDTNRLYLATNPENAGNAANPPYELICLSRESSAKNEGGSSFMDVFNDNKTAVLIGGSAGAALIMCLCVVCMCRRYRKAESFEV
jgi:hypothetical protein